MTDNLGNNKITTDLDIAGIETPYSEQEIIKHVNTTAGQVAETINHNQEIKSEVNNDFLSKINSLLTVNYVNDNEYELLDNFQDALDNEEFDKEDEKNISDKIYEYLLKLKNIISSTDLSELMTRLSNMVGDYSYLTDYADSLKEYDNELKNSEKSVYSYVIDSNNGEMSESEIQKYLALLIDNHKGKDYAIFLLSVNSLGVTDIKDVDLFIYGLKNDFGSMPVRNTTYYFELIDFLKNSGNKDSEYPIYMINCYIEEDEKHTKINEIFKLANLVDNNNTGNYDDRNALDLVSRQILKALFEFTNLVYLKDLSIFDGYITISDIPEFYNNLFNVLIEKSDEDFLQLNNFKSKFKHNLKKKWHMIKTSGVAKLAYD